MKADIYLHRSKEANYDLGAKLNLCGVALDRFLYACCEVKVTVEINTETGDATIVAVDDKPVAK